MRWSCKIFKKCFYSDTKQKVTNLQLDFNWTLSIIRFYVSSNAATFWCISAQFANYFNVKSYIFGGRDWKDLSTYLWKKTQTKSIVFFAFFLFIFHIDRDNNAIQAFFRDIVRVIWTFSNLWLFTFEAQKQTVLKLVANVPA